MPSKQVLTTLHYQLIHYTDPLNHDLIDLSLSY